MSAIEIKDDKKLTITCRVGDENDTGHTIQEKFFFDIVNQVTDLITQGLNNKELKLDFLHPRTTIAIVVSNIIINLFNEAAHSANPETKHAMLDSLLEEIKHITVEGYKTCFHSYEAMKNERH